MRYDVQDAGGRLHDPAALIALYGDNENITYIQEGAQKAIYFFNLTTTYPTLREILKDVDVVVDETYYRECQQSEQCHRVGRRHTNTG